ncbi:GNAT family N-acetyltransferase [Ureibacillus acetophenoni]|uniref:Acetyltransferase (GNAT) family protein n=1 Tax=Ureibacillus acetophenoni TaxID=614649 RepID=A0A285UVA9_9BACL|nr:GNAT family N-acetyltransferase [Ureibacillus acetophenoni]SOC44656.1 acetyltransferase (GNAT) family protein [Ureibacillus acetophenoni]
MGNNELIALFHKELREDAEVQGYTREKTEHVIRHISKFGERGFILSSNVNENNAREVIKSELNYFKNLNQDFEWKVYSYDKPDHLKDILKQEGFTIGDPEALMVMKLDDQHPLLNDGQYPNIKEITDEQGIKELIELEHAIWNESLTELGERLWRDKQNNPESVYLYGIYEDGQLVSAAWMYLEKDSSFASLWGGSTLPLSRGKGYYSQLLAVRAQKAYEKGHPYLTVDASPMSRPILEKCGFHCIAYSYECQSPKIK